LANFALAPCAWDQRVSPVGGACVSLNYLSGSCLVIGWTLRLGGVYSHYILLASLASRGGK
jgi:hypothetical protein